MFNVLVVADESEPIRKLMSGLAQAGFACRLTSDHEAVVESAAKQAPDLVLVDMKGPPPTPPAGFHLAQRLKQERRLPVIALLRRELLGSFDFAADIDDFVIEPWDATEVAVRAKRTLPRNNGTDNKELITCGDLVIDRGKYEVSVAGRVAALTFKEYELLTLLASNKGRVFTRETLLNRAWGYDYYGGDRTVDVHIRRLRSKLEDSTHTFIETVRNIGYRFRDNP